MILEFGGDVKKEHDFSKKVETNSNDYNNFLKFLGISDIKNDYDRKIDVEVEGQKISIWFKKMHIDITKQGYTEKEVIF